MRTENNLFEIISVEEKLGEFAMISAVDLIEHDQVTLLVLPHSTRHSQQKFAAICENYIKFAETCLFPNLQFYAQEAQSAYIAVDLLGGSLEKTREDLSGGFSPSTVYLIASQLLAKFEALEAAGAHLVSFDANLMVRTACESGEEIYYLDSSMVASASHSSFRNWFCCFLNSLKKLHQKASFAEQLRNFEKEHLTSMTKVAEFRPVFEDFLFANLRPQKIFVEAKAFDWVMRPMADPTFEPPKFDVLEPPVNLDMESLIEEYENVLAEHLNQLNDLCKGQKNLSKSSSNQILMISKRSGLIKARNVVEGQGQAPTSGQPLDPRKKGCEIF